MRHRHFVIDLTILLYDRGHQSPDNPAWQSFHPNRYGHFDNFLQMLQEAAPDLETLEIGPTDTHHAWWLDYVVPIRSLRGFLQLRSIRMPQMILFGIIYTDIVTAYSILPQPIQHLQIDCSLDTFEEVLNLIYEDRARFPFLETVTMNCADIRGGMEIAPWDENDHGEGFMRHRWNRSSGVQRLCTTAIKPRLTYLGSDEFWDDVYDAPTGDAEIVLSCLPAAIGERASQQ